MANRIPENPTPFTTSWLIGIGLTALGFLTLLLMLGWFAYLELLALTGGLGVMSGIFLLYFWTHPTQRWAAWASYLIFNVAAFFGVGFLLDFTLPLYIVWGAFLLGLPFLVMYVRQIWVHQNQTHWWSAIPAGGLITLAFTLLQLRLGWPDNLLPGILVFTFMGGITGTLFLLWFPNRRNANYRWMIGPMVLTALITALGTLITIDMVILAPPAVLLIFGGYFLIKFVVQQWEYEEKKEKEAAALSAPPPLTGLPPGTPITPFRPELPPSAAPLALPQQTLTGSEAPIPPATIHLYSLIFQDGRPIPPRYTCDGDNASPPLEWRSLPSGARSLALICDTPDAPGGITTHWVLYNLPGGATSLPAGIPPGPVALGGASQGLNDFGRTGYDGPCPPPGQRQRYFFKLYALGIILPIPPGTTKREVVQAMQGNILATGQFSGVYQRGALPPRG